MGGDGSAFPAHCASRLSRSKKLPPTFRRPSGPPTLPATLCEVTDTPNAAITLSDKAVAKIGELLAGQEENDQALRVAVRGGGCSGFQYALAFDKAKGDDHVFTVDGVSVVVDKVSMQFVFGSEVDYVEGLQGAGFQVNNP
ncbi:MAG: iron-sulfur cluster assembly accessory protein, partial [Actinobacteria bacterium]|nr:iron-sulfur cluster assembly accessory protein [Actinomycetota bacterium]